MARRPINTASWRHECGTTDLSVKNNPHVAMLKIAMSWRNLCFFAHPQVVA